MEERREVAEGRRKSRIGVETKVQGVEENRRVREKVVGRRRQDCERLSRGPGIESVRIRLRMNSGGVRGGDGSVGLCR